MKSSLGLFRGDFKRCLVFLVVSVFKWGSKLYLPKSALKLTIACIIDEQ